MVNEEYQWVRIQGTIAGTTVYRTNSGVLKNFFIPITKTGTIGFYDTNVATGTAATNEICFPIPNVVGTPNMYEFNWKFKTGLTVVVGGTVDCTMALS